MVVITMTTQMQDKWGRRADLRLERDDLWDQIADLTEEPAKPADFHTRLEGLNLRLVQVNTELRAVELALRVGPVSMAAA